MEASALMATAIAHHAIPWPGGLSTPLPCATAMACPATVGRHIKGCPLSAWPQWPGDHSSGLHRSEKLEMVLGRLLFLGHCTKRLKYTSRLHVKKAHFLFQGASAWGIVFRFVTHPEATEIHPGNMGKKTPYYCRPLALPQFADTSHKGSYIHIESHDFWNNHPGDSFRSGLEVSKVYSCGTTRLCILIYLENCCLRIWLTVSLKLGTF